MTSIPVTAHIDGHPEPLEGTFEIERDEVRDYSGSIVFEALKTAILTVPGRIGSDAYPGDRITYRITYRIVAADGTELKGYGWPATTTEAIYNQFRPDYVRDLDEPVSYVTTTEIRGGLDR